MKRIIPNFNPFNTREVWCPWNVDSRITSRHHWTMVERIRITPKINRLGPYEWNQAARPAVRLSAPRAPIRGQGLGSTKWKGWRNMGIFFGAIFLLGR